MFFFLSFSLFPVSCRPFSVRLVTLKDLLEANADPNITDSACRTALSWAVTNPSGMSLCCYFLLVNRVGHAHAVGVQSRYKICNAKLGAVACDPKMAGLCWKRKWKVQLMCIYMILTKTLSIPLF